MFSVAADGLIARARALAPLVRDCRAAIERERRLPDALVQAFVAAGFMRVKLPACLGGVGGGHPVTAIRIVEEVSREDGAAGWNLCWAPRATRAAWPQRSCGCGPGEVSSRNGVPPWRRLRAAGRRAGAAPDGNVLRVTVRGGGR